MANKKLTKKQIEKYLKQHGIGCPYCGGDIEGNSIDVDDGGASQKIHCLDCGRRWLDTYTLTGIIEL